jgi:predicted amidohydrolase
LAAQRHTAQKTHLVGSALDDWLTWFAHWKDEDIMNQIAHPAVIQAAQQLEALSANEETRLMADARELAMLTERLEINAAEKRGEARGVAFGLAQGTAQAMETAVARMVANGMSEAQARLMLGLN